MFKLAQSESLDELRRLWSDPALFFPSWCGVAQTPIKDVKMGLWFSQPFKANFYTELPDTVRMTLAKEATTVGQPCPYEQATDNPLPVFPLVFTCPSCKDKNEHTYDVLDVDTHVCGVCAGKCQLPVVDFFSHRLFFSVNATLTVVFFLSFFFSFVQGDEHVACATLTSTEHLGMDVTHLVNQAAGPRFILAQGTIGRIA